MAKSLNNVWGTKTPLVAAGTRHSEQQTQVLSTEVKTAGHTTGVQSSASVVLNTESSSSPCLDWLSTWGEVQSYMSSAITFVCFSITTMHGFIFTFFTFFKSFQVHDLVISEGH